MIKDIFVTKELIAVRLKKSKDQLICPNSAKGQLVIQDNDNFLYRYIKENNFKHAYQIIQSSDEEFLEDFKDSFWTEFINSNYSKTLLLFYQDSKIIARFILIRINNSLIIAYKKINEELKAFYLEILLDYYGDNFLIAEFSDQNKNKSNLYDIYPFHKHNLNSFDLIQDFYHNTKDPRIKEILYNGMASEININLKYLLYNGYKIYEPFSKVDDSKSFEMINDNGFDYMKLSYQEAQNYPVEIEESNFYQFKKCLPLIEEFQSGDFVRELAMVEHYGGKFLVYKVNNQIISGGVLEIVGQEVCYFSYAFTLPEQRGNHYFDFILKALNSYSYQSKKDILLSVYNPIAKKKYQQYGFKKIGYILSK